MKTLTNVNTLPSTGASLPSTVNGRWTLRTGDGRCAYTLPSEVGEILSVRYVEGDYPDGLQMFEAPIQRSYLHVWGFMLEPRDEASAKMLLEKAFREFHAPVWYRLGDKLIVYPPPVNQAYLVVEATL